MSINFSANHQPNLPSKALVGSCAVKSKYPRLGRNVEATDPLEWLACMADPILIQLRLEGGDRRDGG